MQPTSTLQSLAGFLPLGLINVGSSTKDQIPEPSPSEDDTSVESTPDYPIPKPRAAFSAFVDHPQEFITFLEALTNQQNPKEEDKVDLFTTLFEMYLDTAKRQKDTGDKAEWENKAKKLIEGKDVRAHLLTVVVVFLSHTIYLDSYLDIQCPTAIRPIRLPGRFDTCP